MSRFLMPDFWQKAAWAQDCDGGIAVPGFRRQHQACVLPYADDMKKRVPILAAVVLAGLVLFWLSSGGPTPDPDLAVQFLGFTNEPTLGASALLGITNGTGRRLLITGMGLETKPFEDWHPSPTPMLWQQIGSSGTFGPRNLAIISISQGRGFVAVVAKPTAHEPWRVRVDCVDQFSQPVVLLNRLTLGWSYRFFVHKNSSVESPEMSD
jgi:hypothetical protein